MVINLTLNDISEIATVSRAMKQRDFMLINHNNRPILVGLDTYKIYMTIATLDPEKFTLLPPDVGFIFNYKAFAKFVANLSIEKEISIDMEKPRNLIISFMGNAGIYIDINNRLNAEILVKLRQIDSIDHLVGMNGGEEDVSELLSMLYTHHKSDGGLYYIHEDKYYITLAYGILPVNKNDKIYLAVVENNNQITYVTRFRVSKKKFDIYAYVEYRHMR